MLGATDIYIFTGIMDVQFILEDSLIPFLRQKFAGCEHRFMQDNDPKHCSGIAKQFFEDNNVNWWRPSPESLDLNPIENVWHELKEFLRARVKPKINQSL